MRQPPAKRPSAKTNAAANAAAWIEQQMRRFLQPPQPPQTFRLPAVQAQQPPAQEWMRALMQTPFVADTLAQLVGAMPRVRDAGAVPGEPGVMASVPSNGAPAIRWHQDPAAIGSDDYRRTTLEHEFGHLYETRNTGTPAWQAVMNEFPNRQDPQRWNGDIDARAATQPSEHFAEAFRGAVEALRHVKTRKDLLEVDRYNPGTYLMAEALLKHPIYAHHPLNSPAAQ
jgi:hypothetical protein